MSPEALLTEIADVVRALELWSGSPAQPAPKNARGRRTRELLLDAANRTFIRNGYVDCSVEDILQEAAISRRTFYAHFKSKKSIFAAVIARSIESRLTSTNVSRREMPLVQDRIRESVRKYLDLFYQPTDLSLVIEQTAYHDPSFQPVRLLIRDSFARRVAKGIRGQQARGIADPDVDPDEAGRVIISMMTHFALTEIGWRKRRPTEEMVDMLALFWMNGISLRPEHSEAGAETAVPPRAEARGA